VFRKKNLLNENIFSPISSIYFIVSKVAIFEAYANLLSVWYHNYESYNWTKIITTVWYAETKFLLQIQRKFWAIFAIRLKNVPTKQNFSGCLFWQSCKVKTLGSEVKATSRR